MSKPIPEGWHRPGSVRRHLANRDSQRGGGVRHTPQRRAARPLPLKDPHTTYAEQLDVTGARRALLN